MSEDKDYLTTNRKALTINLDDSKYGTFAEIGAGQEVARVFFRGGGASKTIAKTISAYDMTFSDAIYGKSPRYVSKERLTLMLDHEYELLYERLAEQRGGQTEFFVFADTVSARNYTGTNEAHGWVGARFQCKADGDPSEIIMHVRMWDKETVLQQEALGIVGTNLLYGAFYYRDEPLQFIRSLLDNLSYDRMEVDMLEFRGPEFSSINNRKISLSLVELGLTNAAMFGPNGAVLHPSEVLYKKAILMERGSFRPVTHVNVDMIKCAKSQLLQNSRIAGKDLVCLLEITVHESLTNGELDFDDILTRVDLLGEIEYPVLISNYAEYYRLMSYFRRYTKETIGIALGINSLRKIFDEKHYENLEGGILESFGRLFSNAVKLYIHPMRQELYHQYLKNADHSSDRSKLMETTTTGDASVLLNAKNVQITNHLRNLYAHLLENNYIECIDGFDPNLLHISARDVLRRIREQDDSWERMVPTPVANAIKTRGLFDLQSSSPKETAKP